MPALLGDIKTGAQLAAAETVDKSSPAVGAAAITQNATRRKSAAVMTAIEGGGAALKPVVAKSDDRSAPKLEAGTGARPNPAKSVFAEISSSKSLKPATTADRSAPAIDKAAAIAPSARPALFNEIKQASMKSLAID